MDGGVVSFNGGCFAVEGGAHLNFLNSICRNSLAIPWGGAGGAICACHSSSVIPFPNNRYM